MNEQYQYKAGDILVEVWGYNMTFATFFRVESVSSTGKSVKIVELHKEMLVGQNCFCPKAIPTDKINEKGKSGTKRVKSSGHMEGFYGKFIALWSGKPINENHFD